MSRMGSFAAMPRIGSNPTGAVESLLAQQENATWQAIQDAWKNGGTVTDENGNPVQVTDQYVLDYMRKRRDEVGDPNDPIYQQWNNNAQQVQFGIDESKIGLRYKQGKINERGVAAWYRSQLGKYPKDSEVYRNIAGQVATWERAAKSSATGSARASVIKALNARLTKNDVTVGAYNLMLATLTEAAQRAGLCTKSLYDAKDPEALKKFIDSTKPGGYSWSDFQAGVDASWRAYDDSAKALQQAGRPDDAQKVAAERNKFLDQAVYPLNTFDDVTMYNLGRAQYEKEIADAQNDPDAIKAANDRWAAKLQGLIVNGNKTDSPADVDAIQQWQNEINAMSGKDTGKTMTEVRDPSQTGDAAETAKFAATLPSQQAALANGTAYYGQAVPGGKLGVYSYAEVKGWTWDPQAQKYIAPDNFQVQTVTVGGQTKQAVMAGNPIAKVVLAKDGKILSAADIAQLGGYDQAVKTAGVQLIPQGDMGYYWTDSTGKTIQWAVRGADGKLVFTTRDPFGNGLVTDPDVGRPIVVVTGSGDITADGKLKEGGAQMTLNQPDIKVVAPGTTPPQGSFVGSTTFDPSRPPEEPAGMSGVSFGGSGPGGESGASKPVGTRPIQQVTGVTPTGMTDWGENVVDPTTGLKQPKAKAKVGTFATAVPTIKLPQLGNFADIYGGSIGAAGVSGGGPGGESFSPRPTAPVPNAPSPAPTVKLPKLSEDTTLSSRSGWQKV